MDGAVPRCAAAVASTAAADVAMDADRAAVVEAEKAVAGTTGRAAMTGREITTVATASIGGVRCSDDAWREGLVKG